MRGLGFKGVPQINNVPPKKDVGSQENKIGPKHSNNWTATILKKVLTHSWWNSNKHFSGILESTFFFFVNCFFAKIENHNKNLQHQACQTAAVFYHELSPRLVFDPFFPVDRLHLQTFTSQVPLCFSGAAVSSSLRRHSSVTRHLTIRDSQTFSQLELC